MPTPRLSDELAQQAIDVYEIHRDQKTSASVLGIHPNTFTGRLKVAQARGLNPTVRKDAPRVYERRRLGRMHVVIPDCQVKAGVPTEHLEWIGNYIAEKRPDVVVQIGDFADMPSLSHYDNGKMAAEGRRYVKDIAAVRAGMERLMAPIKKVPDYHPELHLTMGNHEYRILREVEDNPKYEGRFSYSDLGYEDFGWKVHDFLKVVEIDQIEFAHYFTTGVMGKPVSSAAAMLRERQKSCIQGHVQYTDMAIHRKTQNVAIFSGLCYLHDEPYLGPQGNNSRRQIITCHEVENGRFDPSFISLNFLKTAYS